MMDNDKAARQEKISEDFSPGAPLHVNRVLEVRSETRDGDNVRYDPATAHFRANDAGYEIYLPESCYACRAKEIADQAAEASY